MAKLTNKDRELALYKLVYELEIALEASPVGLTTQEIEETWQKAKKMAFQYMPNKIEREKRD